MRSIIPLGLVLLLAGCGAAAERDRDPLADTAWALDGLAGKSLPADVTVSVQFHEGRVGGSAGCNRYFASYAVAGDSLRLGPAGATKMMCPPPQMAVEEAFLAALSGVRTFKLAGDRLRLLAADGTTLEFAAAPFAAPQE